MKTLRLVVTALAATFAAGLLFVNIYNSLVDAPNWGADIPGSIQATREYFRVANPGSFFRVFSPANQVLTLVALVLCWRTDKTVRYILLGALMWAIVADVFTFAYFYPRNAIMFVNPIEGNLDAIRTAWIDWSNMNWARSIGVAINVCLDFMALIRLSRIWLSAQVFAKAEGI
jgi:hypothetical protein